MVQNNARGPHPGRTSRCLSPDGPLGANRCAKWPTVQSVRIAKDDRPTLWALWQFGLTGLHPRLACLGRSGVGTRFAIVLSTARYTRCQRVGQIGREDRQALSLAGAPLVPGQLQSATRGARWPAIAPISQD